MAKELRDLSFRSVVPGGFASATFSLDRPIGVDAPELAHYTNVEIGCMECGQIVWNGWLEDPGESVGPDGQVWELAAIGPSAHAQDRSKPYVLSDIDISGWERVTLNPTERVDGEIEFGATTDGVDAKITIRVPENTTVNGAAQDQVFTARYRRVIDAGMKLARVVVVWDGGFTGTSVWDVNVVTRTGFTGTGTDAPIADVNTTGGTLNARVGTEFTNGKNVVEFRLRRYGNDGVIPDNNVWVTGIPQVWAMRLDKSGTEVTTSSEYSGSPSAAKIVEDLLGRFLTLYDGANATIGTPTESTHLFAQLTYPDGTTPGNVLNDLMAAHEDMFWAAWEKQANGKYRFEWSQYPTTPRYVISARDGYSAPTSAADVFNEAVVRYKSPSGAYLTVTRTLAVPELDDIGRTRTLPLDLGDNTPSLVNAQRVGDAQLAAHAEAPAAGTLTVARPVYDRDRGMMVQPWEIRAGCRIMVQETGREHSVTSATYRVSDASATLELDAPALTMANTLGRPAGRRAATLHQFPTRLAITRRR